MGGTPEQACQGGKHGTLSSKPFLFPCLFMSEGCREKLRPPGGVSPTAQYTGAQGHAYSRGRRKGRGCYGEAEAKCASIM